MAYEPQVWVNEPSTDTPLSADRLAYIEDGISSAHAGVENFELISGDWNDFPLGWCIGLPDEDNAPSNGVAVVLTQEGIGYAEGAKVQRCHWVDPATTDLRVAQRFFDDSAWGDWAFLRSSNDERKSSVLITAASTVSAGSVGLCIFGNYQVDVADGESPGDTVTLLSDYGATTNPTDVRFFDLMSQSYDTAPLPAWGAQMTLYYFKDVEFPGVTTEPISGWHAITTLRHAPPS
ncbi:hypothetical protein [Mycobacterium sp. SMC-11]|uniref:hypothetical protein n=1 Tax=Mycobacterium sp. SMC-11 TaxID=3385969 RepID=UPI00390C52ED